MKRRFQLRLPRPRLPSLSQDWPVRLGMIGLGLILTSLTVYFVFQFVSLVWQGKEQEQQIAQSQTAIALQEEQNRQLKDELEYAESDAYVEKMARERLGMARDGEVILIPEIVVRTQTPLPQSARPPALPAQPRRSNWRRWLAALGGD